MKGSVRVVAAVVALSVAGGAVGGLIERWYSGYRGVSTTEISQILGQWWRMQPPAGVDGIRFSYRTKSGLRPLSEIGNWQPEALKVFLIRSETDQQRPKYSLVLLGERTKCRFPLNLPAASHPVDAPVSLVVVIPESEVIPSGSVFMKFTSANMWSSGERMGDNETGLVLEFLTGNNAVKD